MSITLKVVNTQRDLRKFTLFPFTIYKNDPNWVAPLIDDQINKLTPGKHPFWKTAERQLWLALDGKQVVGTIAAIIDQNRNRILDQKMGLFGFFECIDDPQVAKALLDAAGDWLRSRGMTLMRGPYNPSPNDEVGLLIEGFDTRPALLEAHTPAYYADLANGAGLVKFQDLFARLIVRRANMKDLDDAMPEKLARIARKVRERNDLRIRPIDMQRWPEEIALATRIYNNALSGLPDFIPTPYEEFLNFANSFKPFIDPHEAIIAEVKGIPVGYALALPDLNEALQAAKGRLWPFGMLKMWLRSRHLHRATFKIVMILPEYQNRGIEAVLIYEVARSLFRKNYQEVDMSMTGDENLKSNRFQEHLGMSVYRRYRVYQKTLQE